jgi:hypothetical protein
MAMGCSSHQHGCLFLTPVALWHSDFSLPLNFMAGSVSLQGDMDEGKEWSSGWLNNYERKLIWHLRKSEQI